MAGGGGMRVYINVDAAKATDEFKQARRDINGRMKDGLRIAGEKIALPEARTLAPSKTGRLISSLVVKASARSAYLTTNLRGKKGRYVGLLEFGGTIRARIRPRQAKALYFGGRFTSLVTAPRVIRGQHFMTRAVEGRLAQIQEAIGDEVLHAFDGFSA